MNEPQDARCQIAYSLRMDWGPTGAAAIGVDVDVAVVVDVLSFTTTLTVAADRGTVVFPYRWGDERAERYAAEKDATLAVGRSQASAGQVSLSPHTVRRRAGHPQRSWRSPTPSPQRCATARAAGN